MPAGVIFRRIRGRLVPLKAKSSIIPDLDTGLANMNKLRKTSKNKSKPFSQVTPEQLKNAFDQMNKLRKRSA